MNPEPEPVNTLASAHRCLLLLPVCYNWPALKLDTQQRRLTAERKKKYYSFPRRPAVASSQRVNYGCQQEGPAQWGFMLRQDRQTAEEPTGEPLGKQSGWSWLGMHSGPGQHSGSSYGIAGSLGNSGSHSFGPSLFPDALLFVPFILQILDSISSPPRSFL